MSYYNPYFYADNDYNSSTSDVDASENLENFDDRHFYFEIIFEEAKRDIPDKFWMKRKAKYTPADIAQRHQLAVERHAMLVEQKRAKCKEYNSGVMERIKNLYQTRRALHNRKVLRNALDLAHHHVKRCQFLSLRRSKLLTHLDRWSERIAIAKYRKQLHKNEANNQEEEGVQGQQRSEGGGCASQPLVRTANLLSASHMEKKGNLRVKTIYIPSNEEFEI